MRNYPLIRQSKCVQVAKITPLKPAGSNCGGNCAERVVEFNKAVETWGASKSTAASPVIVVDCYTGFDLKADTADSVHPNGGSGTKKMANCWFQPLAAAIKASL
jgi:mannan endo-1,4-beta-mannosidase